MSAKKPALKNYSFYKFIMKLFKAGFLALIGSTSAWNGETHLLIARVAYDQLKKEDP
jgi:hypothetical protein